MNRNALIACVLLGSPVHLLFAADAGRAVRGRVVDPQGQAVNRAWVKLHWIPAELKDPDDLPAPKTTTTDAEGRFAFVLPPNAWARHVVAGKEGLSIDWRGLWRGGAQPTTLRLESPHTFSGRVVNDKDEPIEGATVALVLERTDGNPLDMALSLSDGTPRRHTDEQGRFRFDDLPANVRVGYRVTASGYGPCATDIAYIPFSVSQSDVRIVLRPESRMRGRVVRASDGKALAGVRVQAAGPAALHCDPSPRATTDEKGRFTLTGLSAGRCSVRLVSPPELPTWVGQSGAQTLKPGETSGPAVVEASRGGVLEIALGCEAADAERAPVWGAATVTAAGDGASFSRSMSLRKGSPGRLALPAGTYRMNVDMLEYTVTDVPGEPVAIKVAQTTRLKLTARPVEPIHGVVLDPAGQPAPGAKVYPLSFMCPRRGPVPCDERGRFTLRPELFVGGPMAGVQIVLARDARNECAAMVYKPDRKGRLKVRLQPAREIAGRVLRPDERPIADARVRVELGAPHLGPMWQGGWVETDAAGAYRIPLLPVNEYVVVAEAPGRGRAERRVDVEQPGQTRVPPLVLPPADRTITGTVRGPDGEAIAGAVIRILGKGQPEPPPAAMTDQDGRFALKGLAPGQVYLRADVPGLSLHGQAAVGPDEQESVIHVEPRPAPSQHSNPRPRGGAM